MYDDKLPTKMADTAKIKHMRKMQFLDYISETKAFRANLRKSKHVQGFV